MTTTAYDEGKGIRFEILNSPNSMSIHFETAAEIARWAGEQAKAWSDEGHRVQEVASSVGVPIQTIPFKAERDAFNDVFVRAEGDEKQSRGITTELKSELQKLGDQIASGNILAMGSRAATGVQDLRNIDPEAYVIAAIMSSPDALRNNRVRTMGGSNGLDIRALGRASNVRFPPDIATIDPGAIEMRRERDQWRQEREILRADTNQLKEDSNSIRALEKTYREGLKLKAPVEYWTSRARWQTSTAILTFTCFGLLVIGYGYLAWAVFLPFVNSLHSDTDLEPKLLVLDLAVVTLPSLAFFWVLRLVAKVFVQSIGRAADARERATLVTTYLALCEDTKTIPSEMERLILIRSVSRPGPGDTLDEVAQDTILDQALSALKQR